MAKKRRYVRQMPKIYGNLHRPSRTLGVGNFLRSLGRLLWLIVILFIVYIIFFSSWFKVKKVEVKGSTFSSPEQIKSMVSTGGSIWFLNTNAIKAQVLQDSHVEDVAILRGLPDTIRVVVQEKQPRILWKSGQDSVIINEKGIAFERYTNATLPQPGTKLGDVLTIIPVIVDTKNLPVELGQPIVSEGFVDFISSTEINLNHYLPEVVVTERDVNDTTYDITYKTQQGLQIQFSSLADSDVQVRNLVRLIQQGKADFKSRVDLRIDRWAYVE